MGYKTNGLTFNTLREANIERLKEPKYDKCQAEWSTAHWMQALVGEVGELANILKKIDRGDYLDAPLYKHVEIKRSIENELADIQCYLDLLALKLKVDLGESTIDKFNVISERIGSRVWIDAEDWHLRAEV